MASFVDPRFQRLTTMDDLKLIYNELTNCTAHIHKKPRVSSKQKHEKTIGLSSLFSDINTFRKSYVPKDLLDIEFRNYTNDVSLDMELCPIEWWSETSTLYPTIRQYVKKHLCVPAFANNFHRFPPQYDRIGSIENQKLLWLHLNDRRNDQ